MWYCQPVRLIRSETLFNLKHTQKSIIPVYNSIYIAIIISLLRKPAPVLISAFFSGFSKALHSYGGDITLIALAEPGFSVQDSYVVHPHSLYNQINFLLASK